jgi:hypothetical protein
MYRWSSSSRIVSVSFMKTKFIRPALHEARHGDMKTAHPLMPRRAARRSCLTGAPTMKRVSQRCVDSFALETLELRSMMAADLAGAGITLLNVSQLSGNTPTQPVVFSILNMGDRRAPIGTRVRFYASRDTVLDSGDRVLRDSVLPDPIRPGERVAYTKTIKFPPGMDDGTYRIIMRIDPENRIVESDDTNNDVFSAAKSLSLPGKVESIEINKRYLRPGSAATVVARNVSNLEPSAGEVRFFAVGSSFSSTLIGIGTRSGRDYVLTFIADRTWMSDNVTIRAVAMKHAHVSDYAAGSVVQTNIETRNAGATIGSLNYSTSVSRGQSTTITASGLSSDATYVGVYFDSNFDGLPQIPISFSTNANLDIALGSAASGGSSASISFVVPDWFPAVPTRVFVVVLRSVGMFDSATRVYSIMLSAH